MTADQLSQLQERFVRFVGRQEEIASGWFWVLAGLYGSEGRHYHTMDHIADLLRRLDANPIVGSEQVEYAIWFHDAIYDVQSTKNEEDSAALARSFFRTVGVPGHDNPFPGTDNGNIVLAEEVSAAIIATKHTDMNVVSATSRWMVDLDLAGFADPWEKFEENNQKIRKEYAIYTDEQYRWGRTAFLASLLARPRIYLMDPEPEARARSNIKRHIAELVIR